MLFLGGNTAVRAENKETPSLRAILDGEVLGAVKHDTSMTNGEKLYVHRCAIIEKHIGFDDTPIGQAMKYSCTAPVVGVAFYVGKDLGNHSPVKVANYIKAEFAKNGMVAEVFIKLGHEHGSSVTYFVEGGREILNPLPPAKAINKLEGFVAEVKLVYFKDKKITPDELGKWVKSTTAYIPKIS